MPQVFQVLRCFSCKTFQVHQVKKAKKWNCKMCGEKQSLIKVFCRGTGAECRGHTQRLNQLQGEVAETVGTAHNIGTQCEEFDTDALSQNKDPVEICAGVGRWTQYLDPEKEDLPCTVDDSTYTTDWSQYKAAQNQAKRSATEARKSNKRPWSEEFQSIPKKKFQPLTEKEESFFEKKLVPLSENGHEPEDYSVASMTDVRSGMQRFSSDMNEKPGTSWEHKPSSLQCELGHSARVPYYARSISKANFVPDNLQSVPEQTARPSFSIETNSSEKFGSKPKRLKLSSESVVKPGSKWGKFLANDDENNDSSEEFDDHLSEPVASKDRNNVLQACPIRASMKSNYDLKCKDSNNILSPENLFLLDDSDEENLINFDV